MQQRYTIQGILMSYKEISEKPDFLIFPKFDPQLLDLLP
jgi:hypothetical protein